ncbi:PepSY domain-containing protein [Acetobacteraceae bacterium KSS8]|uniref:PepSY domain-containing protein n=1 Tax=Endosaccharibacter trunci TaxID=2812733 RepID=A0ABT1W6V8_9PROT|nr:PepSY domain-containing protein [Acetobacteraceae bacterium KSS8]
MTRPRAVLLRLHRYAGLALAAFLLLAGPTGSVAAFHEALDGWLNPDLFRARTSGPPLPVDELAKRLREQVPNGRLGYLVYRPAPGFTVHAYLQPAPGHALSQSEVFLDPATGAIQGTRNPDDGCCARRTIIPFLYRFHYSLGMGRTGILVMGIVALIWSLDCMTGLLLTLPVRWRPWRRGDWRRWGVSWRIEPDKRGIRRVFDLHRAFSLWLWIVLLGIAISGVSLNLPDQVFRPVVAALLPVSAPPATGPTPPTASRRIDLDEADRIAGAAARAHGWKGRPGALFMSGQRIVVYFNEADGKRVAGLGGPVVTLDAATGAVTQVVLPGRGKLGDTVLELQFPFHSGELLGLPGRILVAAIGLVVPVLVVTGLLIWQRKRRPRRRSVRQVAGNAGRAAPEPALQPVRPS